MYKLSVKDAVLASNNWRVNYDEAVKIRWEWPVYFVKNNEGEDDVRLLRAC